MFPPLLFLLLVILPAFAQLPPPFPAVTVRIPPALAPQFDDTERGFELYASHRVQVTHLGVFDFMDDGFQGIMAARVWIQGNPLIPVGQPGSADQFITQLIFTPADPGFMVAGYRYKQLPAPLVLPQGTVAIITASGWSPADPYGNNTVVPGNIGLQPVDGSLLPQGISLISFQHARVGNISAPLPPPSPPPPAPPRFLWFSPEQHAQQRPYLYFASASVMVTGVEGFAAVTVPMGTGLSSGYLPFYKFIPPGLPGFPVPFVKLGPKFLIKRPIVITHLGVFDAGENGIAGMLNVTIWNEAEEPLASLIFSAGDDGVLDPGTSMRYKPLPSPIRFGCLSSGMITIEGNSPLDPYLIAEMADPLTNLIAASQFWRYDVGDDAIRFTEIFFIGLPMGFSTFNISAAMNDARTFAGGSFKFQQIMGKLQQPLNTHLLVPKAPVPLPFAPICICTDKRGYFYVGEQIWIHVFDQSWKHLTMMNVAVPFACTVDEDLNLYVAAVGEYTIFKFDVSQSFVQRFGSGRNGNLFWAENDLANARALTLSHGYLWVQDSYNSSTLQYNPTTGQLVNKMGGKISSSPMMPPGFFLQSEGLDSWGESLFVADVFGARVHRFDMRSGIWSRFDNEQVVGNVWDVIVHQETGYVVTGEFDDTRIQLLNQCGETVAQAATRAHKMAFVGDNLYAVDNTQNIFVFEIQCRPNYFGRDCDKVCRPCNPLGGKCNEGLHGDGTCICKPGFSGPDCGLQFARKDVFTTFGYSDPFSPATSGYYWNPYGIALGPDGTLYVTEVISNLISSVRQFYPNGTLIRTIGSNFGGPRGVAVDAISGQIYIVDATSLYIYNPDGVINGTWNGSPFGPFTGVGAVAFHAQSRVAYIAVSGAIVGELPYILRFDTTTGQWTKIDVFFAPDLMSVEAPNTIAVDQMTGELYYMSFRTLFRLKPTGGWESVTNQIFNENYFTVLGGGLVSFGDVIYAALGTLNVVNLFTKSGMLIGQWGMGATQDGPQLSLANPKGLALDPRDGTLYIADNGHHRVVALKQQYDCVDGFFGPQCAKCLCPELVSICNDGIAGNGSCQCTNFFAGANCDRCIAGYKLVSPTECSPCPEGTFSSDGITCQQCTPGTYNPTIGQSECFKCPAGKFSSEYGADECEGCSLGHYNDVEGAPTCLPCQPGSFASIGGQQVCTPCNSLSFTNETEAVACALCPTYSAPNINRTACVCGAGYFPGPVIEGGDMMNCITCPSGGDCSNGILITAPGYWRSSVHSRKFFPCPNPDSCKPPADMLESVVCDVGYSGKLCAVCAEKYYSSGTNECTECPAGGQSRGVVAGIVILIIILVILLFCKNYIIKFVTKLLAKATEFTKLSLPRSNSISVVSSTDSISKERKESRSEDESLPFMSIFKSIVSFLQVISQIGIVYQVPWPTTYTTFNNRSSFVNLDIFSLASVECTGSRDTTNYYTLLLLMTLVPIVLLVAMVPITWIVVMIAKRYGIIRAISSSRYTIVRNFLALAFVVYTGVSTKVLQIFDCQEFDDGSSWLKTDYSVRCYTSTYNKFLAYAIIMLILYPVGLLVTATFLIHRFRNRLGEQKIKDSIGILYAEFKHSGNKSSIRFTKYWECVNMIRKLLITALIRYIATTVVWQVGIATFISVVALVLHVHVRPYISGAVFNLEFFSLSIIAFSFFISVFIRTKSFSDSTRDGFVVFILVLEMLFVAYAVVLVLQFIWKKITTNKKEHNDQSIEMSASMSVNSNEKS